MRIHAALGLLFCGALACTGEVDATIGLLEPIRVIAGNFQPGSLDEATLAAVASLIAEIGEGSIGIGIPGSLSRETGRVKGEMRCQKVDHSPQRDVQHVDTVRKDPHEREDPSGQTPGCRPRGACPSSQTWLPWL